MARQCHVETILACDIRYRKADTAQQSINEAQRRHVTLGSSCQEILYTMNLPRTKSDTALLVQNTPISPKVIVATFLTVVRQPRVGSRFIALSYLASMHEVILTNSFVVAGQNASFVVLHTWHYH